SSSCRPTVSGGARCGASSPRRSSPPRARPAWRPRRIRSSRPIHPRRCTWCGASPGSSSCSPSRCGASREKSSDLGNLILVKHAMPQVDVETPAHEWRLGPVGVAGAGTIATTLGKRYAPSRIVASQEPKATQTGAIIAERLHLPLVMAEGLHEHDRRAIGSSRSSPRSRIRGVSDAMFRRMAGWCAYGIAVLSLLYAGVYLGLVRPDPTNATASALANAFIGLSGILATFAVIAIGDRVDGAAGRWLRVVGVGWALLSAAHGVFSAVSAAQGLPTGDLSATDPRGFAT